MRPEDGRGTFVRGAAVAPRDQLLDWLGKQVRDGQPRLLRLPVVLKRKGARYSNSGARIGGTPDALEVYLNDAALGISLADRAKTACNDAEVCALWLEGYWKGQQAGSLTFDVVKVGDPIAADAVAAANFAEVEGESGN